MSGNLFLDLQNTHDQMESILSAKYPNYNVSVVQWKIKDEIFFTAQVTTTDREGKKGYIKADGDSFADLFQKIANKL
jgi:hypothetical protein